MKVTVKTPSCKINFKDMIVSQNPPSLEEALLNIQPFELSQDVKSGKTQILVDIEKELMNSCVKGDIILIESYKSNGVTLPS